MSMQQYPRNPIEQRKRAVRTYSRNGVVSVVGGAAGGILLSTITGASFFSVSWTDYRRGRRLCELPPGPPHY